MKTCTDITLEKYQAGLTQALADQTRDLRDFVEQKNLALKTEILQGVGELFDQNILSQLEEHDQRIAILEDKLAGTTSVR